MGSTDFSVSGGIETNYPPDFGGSDPGGSGPGGTSYDPWDNGPPGGGWTSDGPNTPPPGATNPKTGRETPNATVQVVSVGYDLIGTGTPQQLLGRLPSLLSANAADTKDFAGHPAPQVRLPSGSYVRFASTADLQNYLTRSATPVVPTVTVSATFQGVTGRPPSARDTDQAESAFDNGKSLADYRAGLAASPETAGTLRGVSLQVLGRDVSPAELGAYQAQLTAGKTIDALRSDLSKTTEATNDVQGLYQSVLGRAASAPDTAGTEARLAQGGSLADVRQALATSQEAGNAVIGAFEAELGRAPSAQNITDAQGLLAAPGGSLDGVRAYLSTTQEAHDDVAAAFQNELGRPATDQNIADMQHSLAAPGGSLDNIRAYAAGTQEAATDITDLYEYGLGRAPTAAELSSAQATLAKDGSLRDTYQSLSGIAGAGLVGNADQFSAVLRQAHLLDAGTPGAPSATERALQGVLSWAASNAPKLTAGGVAGAILLTPVNSQQVTTDVGVADHPELGARYQRAPGSISGTVTLYMRGPDGQQPASDGLTLNMDAQGRLTGPLGTPIAGLNFGTLPPFATDGGVQLTPGLDAKLSGPQAPPGNGIEVRTQEEADLVASLQAAGKSTQEIENALENLRYTGGIVMGDSARAVTGPGRLSNPVEIENIRQAVQALGVGVTERPGNLGYQPALKAGSPSTLVRDPDASYSAWLHEYQHVIDDQAAGWSGYRIMENTDAVWQREQSAYNREITLMRSQGHEDVAKQLEGNLEAERKRLFGLK